MYLEHLLSNKQNNKHNITKKIRKDMVTTGISYKEFHKMSNLPRKHRDITENVLKAA